MEYSMLRLPQPKQELDPIISSILNQRNAQRIFGSGIACIFYLIFYKVYASKYLYIFLFTFLKSSCFVTKNLLSFTKLFNKSINS